MEIREEGFFVDPDIKKAETLPPRAFTDECFAELERERIFQNSWLFVPECPSANKQRILPLPCLLSERGAQYPFVFFDTPLFLQCDCGGRLHCFSNVCTHAWNTLVDKFCEVKKIVCSQHGRQFDLQGKYLAHAPFVGLPQFPRLCDDLSELSLKVWRQSVFVSLGNPEPLHKYLDDMETATSLLPHSEMRRVPQEAEVRAVEGNWKLHVWNFLDKFHIPFVHKGLARAIDISSYHTEIFENSVLQWVYAKNPLRGFPHPLLPERFRDPEHPEKRVFALWWFVFPNMAFSYYPWGISVNMWMPIPGTPEKTLFHWYHFDFDELKYEVRDEWWLSGLVDQEDTTILENVRKGVRSPFAMRGKFAPEKEASGHWFHRKISEMVFSK